MGNESKNKGASSLGGGGFRAKMEHYVYSGEKKHVFAGIGIITIIFGIPWYLMNQGPFSNVDYNSEMFHFDIDGNGKSMMSLAVRF